MSPTSLVPGAVAVKSRPSWPARAVAVTGPEGIALDSAADVVDDLLDEADGAGPGKHRRCLRESGDADAVADAVRRLDTLVNFTRNRQRRGERS